MCANNQQNLQKLSLWHFLGCWSWHYSQGCQWLLFGFTSKHTLLRTFFLNELLIIVKILSFRVVFLLRSLLFSFVILWWSITVEHVKWSARSFEQPWNSFGFIGLIINAEKEVVEEEEEVKVEGIFSLKRSRGMKISVFMPAKKPLLEERVQVYVYRI